MAEATTAPQPPRLKRSLVIAVGAVNALAIVGVAYSVLAMGSAEPPPPPPAQTAPADAGAAPAEAEHAPAEAEHPEPQTEPATAPEAAPAAGELATGEGRKNDEPGLVVVLDPFVVNLADADSPRYLKVDIALEVADGKGKAEIERGSARVRDAILAYLSGLSTEQTMGPLGKSDMRFALKARINRTLRSEPVVRVYFTQFIVH